MAAVNFGNFTIVSPQPGDYFVGYRGATETRSTIESITGLNAPYFNTLATLNSKSFFYDNSYTLFSSNSGLYNSTYNSVNGLSSNWQGVYSYINSTSADTRAVRFNMNDVIATSANWNGAYTFATASAVFLDTLATASQYKLISGVYVSAATITNQISALSISVYTTVSTFSASWYGGNQAYTYVYWNSANDYKVRFNMNDVIANSAYWDAAYYFTAGAGTSPGSAAFIDSINVANTYKTASATYITYQNLSSANVAISAVTVVTSLSVAGDLIIFANLPTSSTGLPQGAVYKDGGFLKIV